ncbi:MAG: LptE family protein [Gemmatimonadetes bacterium]|nr:LptE family protein [Gemmatimonadota bacterium]
MSPFLQTSGTRAVRPSALPASKLLALGLALACSGCLYGFQAGAGFPDYVRTVAIVPFENETTRPEITDEVFNLLLREFPRSQGLQPAGEDVADAVIRGTITRYDVSTPSYRAGAAGDVPQVLQRQVSLTVQVQIINQVDNEILWESNAVSVRGEFMEETETEDAGRALAIELLVQRIIDGAQSNW